MSTRDRRFLNESKEDWQSLKRSLCTCYAKIDSLLVDVPQSPYDSVTQMRTGAERHVDVNWLSNELHTLFSEARSLEDQMNQLAQGNPVLTAQLQGIEAQTVEYKHRSRQYLKRIADNITRQRLLRGSNALEHYPNTVTQEQATLLQEKSNIYSSLSVLDETLCQGGGIMKNMGHQGERLKNSYSVLQRYIHKFPTIHGTIVKIQTVQSRRSLILIVITAFCVVLALFYLFH